MVGGLLDSSSGVAADVRWLKGKGRFLGYVGFLLLFELFLLVATLDQSPLLPSPFYALWGDLLFYTITGVTAVLIVMAVVDVPRTDHGRLLRASVIEGGSWPTFLRNWAVTGLLAWAVLSAFEFAFGGATQAISDSDVLTLAIFEFGVVAVNEELFFRLALPATMNPWFASTVVFALYHLPVDLATYGVSNLSVIIAAFFERVLAGLVLYVIFKYAGLGAAMAAHGAYDYVLETGATLHVAGFALVPV